MKKLNIVLASLLALTAVSAQADVANAEKLAQKYTTIAKIVNPGYAGPSAVSYTHLDVYKRQTHLCDTRSQ